MPTTSAVAQRHKCSQPEEQALLQSQELDEKAKSALGSKGGLPPTTVVDRLRKRLRMNGYRCHLTLQVTTWNLQGSCMRLCPTFVQTTPPTLT